MAWLRILLLPFSLLYGGIVLLRNQFYYWGWLKRVSFEEKTIVIGNLSVGGTGKTPHTEYLARLFKDSKRTATLSRGYGRTTSGFLEVRGDSKAAQVGDEPLQFKRKFPSLTVAVDGDRVNGIRKLLSSKEKVPEVILLDDAFQHLAVKAGFYILLTPYKKPYSSDWMLPAGRLREPKGGAKRADVIIVTKCPDDLSAADRKKYQDSLKPSASQRLYFSYIEYQQLHSVWDDQTLTFAELTQKDVVLLTGIADPAPLLDWLDERCKSYQHISFADHHNFTSQDVEKVKKIFDNIAAGNKLVLTTEKDAMRLRSMDSETTLTDLPLYYLEMAIRFHGTDGTSFDEQLTDYVGNH